MAVKKNKNVYFNELSLLKIVFWSAVISCLILLGDEKVIYYKLKDILGLELLIIFAASAVLVLLISLLKYHFFNLLKLPCGNVLDELLFVGLISSAVIFGCEYYLGYLLEYKMYILVGVFGICLFVLIVRMIYCLIRRIVSSAKDNKLVDLCDFLSPDFIIKPSDKPLLFSEDASKEDLLGRDIIVNTLIDSIKSCKTDKVYTIGLTGAWGSGKSSILSIVKEKLSADKKSVVVIDDFDPWMFGTQEAMLSAMYDEILSCTGIKFSFYSGKKIVRGLLETVTERNKATGLLKNFFESEREYETVKKMKRKISKCLKQMGKTVVFTIDNLDRVDSKNILFLFKIIGSVLDLPNVVYVLAYDSDRIEDVFSDTLNINTKYIEKIVQQEINVPGYNREAIKNIAVKCFDKLLDYYGVEDKAPYRYISKFISNNVNDLRQMKRLFNTAYIIPFCSKKDLYKPDLLAMEVIRFFNTSLYETIRLNPKYFISKDIYYAEHAYLLKGSAANSYNSAGAEFFEKLLNEYNDYRQLLAEVFPNVKKFINNHDLYDPNVNEDISSVKENALCISSGKYFDLYFALNKNIFLDIYEDVNGFIDALNASVDPKEKTVVKILTISNDVIREWLTRFEVCIPNIEESKREPAALGIFDALKDLSNEKDSYYGSIRQRAIVSMVKLTKNSRKEFVESFVELCSANYNVGFIERIAKVTKDLAAEEKGGYRLLSQLSEDKYNKLCVQIVKERIDLYTDERYQKKGIWSLEHYYNLVTNRNTLQEYMLDILNENNVFRIAVDIIHESFENGMFCYSVRVDRIEKLFGRNDRFKTLFNSTTPRNEKEQLIHNIWDYTMKHITGKGGSKRFSSGEKLDL